jgi:cell division protein YceG involved in septum cleavage
MNNIRQKKALLQIFILVMVLVVLTGFEYWRDSGVLVNTDEGRTVTLTVKPEMTVKEIGEVLFQNGIIHNAILKPNLLSQIPKLRRPITPTRIRDWPPGPIASPGMAAIQAVLYPADTSYFYFVAAKDGSHRFSKTYEEHLAAVDAVDKE